jgi:hypothetical protein
MIGLRFYSRSPLRDSGRQVEEDLLIRVAPLVAGVVMEQVGRFGNGVAAWRL